MSLNNMSLPRLNGREITAVLIYLDRRRSRTFVGRLERSKTSGEYGFCYSNSYRELKNALSLGPEFPLTKQKYKSKELFEAFRDRIPAKENPAYPEYLQKFGVSLNEKDPMVLLSTIGRAGPSSFIFEPEFSGEEDKMDFKSFRTELGLTTREFAVLFDISLATVNKIESGKIKGRDVLKRLELYLHFPKTALFEAERNIHKIHASVGERIRDKLMKKANP